MTLNQLYALIESNLTRVGNNRVTAPEIKQVANEIVNFFSSTNPDAFPDWIAAGNYNTNGTGNGRYSKHPDTNGRKRIFETKTSSNVNNAPPTDPAVTENTHWREISQAASAALPEWAPGVFAAGLQLVFHNHSTEGRGLYVLLEPTRPFTSANIETEIVAGQWQRFPAAWSPATGAVLSGPNTISGAFNIGFTNNAVGFGVAPGSITPDTRVDIRGAGITAATNALRVANNDNVELFKVTNAGNVVIALGGNHRFGDFEIIKNGGSSTTGYGILANLTTKTFEFQGQNVGGSFSDLFLFKSWAGTTYESAIIGTSKASLAIRTGYTNANVSNLSANTLLLDTRYTFTAENQSGLVARGVFYTPTINVLGSSPTFIAFDYVPNITALGTATHLAWRNTAGSVLIGGTSLTNDSLIVDIQSTTQAFAPPRMTSTQRDTIASPATGATIIVNDNPLHEGFHFFDLHWRKCVTKNQILSVTSKNITQSVLENTDIPNSVVVTVEAEVQFIQTSGTVGSSAIYYRIQRTFRKTSAGTLAAVAATTTVAFANDTGDTFTTLPQLVINANAVCVQYDISASTKTFNVKASVNYHFSN